MTLSNTPIRLLAKTYANGLLTREQYLEIRSQLLKRLSIKGKITDEDLQNFLKIYQENETVVTKKGYSGADWLIIFLGLLAASVLGYLFFT